jgi:hypothetical protein
MATPRGSIEFGWRCVSTSIESTFTATAYTLQYELKVPVGTTAEVHMPKGFGDVITQDGVAVWSAGKQLAKQSPPTPTSPPELLQGANGRAETVQLLLGAGTHRLGTSRSRR